MKTVIIDNYDSFTYNLVHLVEGIIDEEVTVFLNDKFDLEVLKEFDKIILSPGPCLPKDAGKTFEVLDIYYNSKSILGVCLGHQAIGEWLGCSLKNMKEVLHGIDTEILISSSEQNNPQSIFYNVSPPLIVGRYHSWVIDKNTLHKDLLITAVDASNEIMAIQHKYLDITGVQFHPESIMTNCGEALMKNWLANKVEAFNY